MATPSKKFAIFSSTFSLIMEEPPPSDHLLVRIQANLGPLPLRYIFILDIACPRAITPFWFVGNCYVGGLGRSGPGAKRQTNHGPIVSGCACQNGRKKYVKNHPRTCRTFNGKKSRNKAASGGEKKRPFFDPRSGRPGL